MMKKPTPPRPSMTTCLPGANVRSTRDCASRPRSRFVSSARSGTCSRASTVDAFDDAMRGALLWSGDAERDAVSPPGRGPCDFLRGTSARREDATVPKATTIPRAGAAAAAGFSRPRRSRTRSSPRRHATSHRPAATTAHANATPIETSERHAEASVGVTFPAAERVLSALDAPWNVTIAEDAGFAAGGAEFRKRVRSEADVEAAVAEAVALIEAGAARVAEQVPDVLRAGATVPPPTEHALRERPQVVSTTMRFGCRDFKPGHRVAAVGLILRLLARRIVHRPQRGGPLD